MIWGMNAGLDSMFNEYAARKMEDHFSQIRRCAALLSEEQLWFRANAHSNSVGNLLLHLNGNISQWILGGIGGRAISRDRQAEFDARGPMAREKVLEPLTRTISEACSVIRSQSAEELAREREIQKYRVSGLAAILHVVEHMAFHAGQIVTTTKWLLDVDLSLYDERGHRRDGRADNVP